MREKERTDYRASYCRTDRQIIVTIITRTGKENLRRKKLAWLQVIDIIYVDGQSEPIFRQT